MNKRIEKLAEQAGGFVDLNQHVGGEKGCMVYTYDGLEKFAELIVQECIRKIDDMVDDGWYADTDKLKQHFGVEE